MGKNGYDVYLNKCLLPVTPQKLSVKINNGNKTVKLIDSGEVNVLKAAELTDIELECMIPQVQYPFASYKSGFKKANYFLKQFEGLKTRKTPFQFIVSRTLPNGRVLFSTNIKVSMEDYRISEDAKDGFDLTVKINLKQYRPFGTKTVTIKKEEESKPAQAEVKEDRPAESSPAPADTQTYTVVKGDSLWKIAKRFYGNGAKFTTIHDANRDKVSNPNLIYPGQALTIPPA